MRRDFPSRHSTDLVSDQFESNCAMPSGACPSSGLRGKSRAIGPHPHGPLSLVLAIPQYRPSPPVPFAGLQRDALLLPALSKIAIPDLRHLVSAIPPLPLRPAMSFVSCVRSCDIFVSGLRMLPDLLHPVSATRQIVPLKEGRTPPLCSCVPVGLSNLWPAS